MTIYMMAIASCLFLMSSCDKAEQKLEGKWQLKTIEAEGTIQSVDTVWYNFQTSLFEYQLYDAQKDTFCCNYGYKTLKGDSELYLELVDYGRIKATQFVERYTDWDATTETFAIEESSPKKLVLHRAGKTYTFRKF